MLDRTKQQAPVRRKNSSGPDGTGRGRSSAAGRPGRPEDYLSNKSLTTNWFRVSGIVFRGGEEELETPNSELETAAAVDSEWRRLDHHRGIDAGNGNPAALGHRDLDFLSQNLQHANDSLLTTHSQTPKERPAD